MREKLWRVHGGDKYVERVWTEEGPGGNHGSVMIAECAGRSRKGNAAFIVQACNNYQILVDALIEIENHFCCPEQTFRSIAETALAHVRGEKK